MARVNLTPINAPARYAQAGVAGAWTALDPVDGGQFTVTGQDLLLVRNTNASARTVTVLSVADQYGRSGDQIAAGIAQNGYAIFGPHPLSGWQQTDGRLYINVSGAGIEAMVVRLPYS